jgi:hypothetical protein
MAVENILLAVVPAAIVLAGTLGTQFIQSRREIGRQTLEREREIREARRKYRENIIAPVKAELTKIHSSFQGRALADYISDNIKKQGASIDSKTTEAVESLKNLSERGETRQKRRVLEELLPLAAAITNKDVRRDVEKAFLYFASGKDFREKLNITDDDMDKVFSLAYQRLEDFIALAD